LPLFIVAYLLSQTHTAFAHEHHHEHDEHSSECTICFFCDQPQTYDFTGELYTFTPRQHCLSVLLPPQQTFTAAAYAYHVRAPPITQK